MRILSLLTFLLVFSSQGIGQVDGVEEYPNSVVDLGAGIGPNYGIFGAKAVIGYRGSGFLIGVGSFDGFTTYELGVQVAYQWWYANIGYGPYGSYEINYFGQIDKGLLTGVIFITGGRINLTSDKRAFIELGAGYAGGDNKKTPFGEEINTGGPTFSAGIGFRLGGQ